MLKSWLFWRSTVPKPLLRAWIDLGSINCSWPLFSCCHQTNPRNPNHCTRNKRFRCRAHWPHTDLKFNHQSIEPFMETIVFNQDTAQLLKR